MWALFCIIPRTTQKASYNHQGGKTAHTAHTRWHLRLRIQGIFSFSSKPPLGCEIERNVVGWFSSVSCLFWGREEENSPVLKRASCVSFSLFYTISIKDNFGGREVACFVSHFFFPRELIFSFFFCIATSPKEITTSYM